MALAFSLADAEETTDEEVKREPRVKVYTPSGKQIGIPGVGEGDNKLTFPPSYLVRDALGATWIRFATDAERPQSGWPGLGTWWRISEFQPTTLIHCGADGAGCVAFPHEKMGRFGDRLQAMVDAGCTEPKMMWLYPNDLP